MRCDIGRYAEDGSCGKDGLARDQNFLSAKISPYGQRVMVALHVRDSTMLCLPLAPRLQHSLLSIYDMIIHVLVVAVCSAIYLDLHKGL